MSAPNKKIANMTYAELNALSSNSARFGALSNINKTKVLSRMEKLGGNSTAAPISGSVGTSRLLAMPANSPNVAARWAAAAALKTKAAAMKTRRNRKNRRSTRRNRKNRRN